jgi:XrtJ-associated TM-motif-TM protein
MMRRTSLLIALMLIAIAVPARAQSGCEESPEAPTLVLALIGGAGALAASATGARSRRR